MRCVEPSPQGRRQHVPRQSEQQHQHRPEHEVRHRDADHRDRHRPVVELRVLPQRRVGAGDHADAEREQICQQPERDRHGQRLPENRVDRLSLVSQGEAEVAAKRAGDGLSVLHVPRAVEPVSLAEVLLDGGRNRLLTGVEIAGRQADQAPGERDDDQHHGHRDEEAPQDEPYHLAGSCSM